MAILLGLTCRFYVNGVDLIKYFYKKEKNGIYARIYLAFNDEHITLTDTITGGHESQQCGSQNLFQTVRQRLFDSAVTNYQSILRWIGLLVQIKIGQKYPYYLLEFY